MLFHLKGAPHGVRLHIVGAVSVRAVVCKSADGGQYIVPPDQLVPFLTRGDRVKLPVDCGIMGGALGGRVCTVSSVSGDVAFLLIPNGRTNRLVPFYGPGSTDSGRKWRKLEDLERVKGRA